MSVKLRLTRVGKKKTPMYRVVVADERSSRDGRFIEIIGQYRPLEEPAGFNVKDERALYWLGQGAQPTATVQKLLITAGVWEQFEKSRPKKSLEKAAVRKKNLEAGQKISQEKHKAAKAAKAESEAPAEQASADETADQSLSAEETTES